MRCVLTRFGSNKTPPNQNVCDNLVDPSTGKVYDVTNLPLIRFQLESSVTKPPRSKVFELGFPNGLDGMHIKGLNGRFFFSISSYDDVGEEPANDENTQCL